jgi:transcription-repair coupling factor (superfamily II helicase)
MSERKLESVMLDFLGKRLDLLLSTMIIEAGLDIPNVNTMVVNRADRFGLSQLYQLRGRIGRSSRHATALLLVPPGKKLGRDAVNRLRIIRDYTGLGSGYTIAMRDLEIRGAGNVLGGEQHGFISAIGFETYYKLLEETVKEIKGIKEHNIFDTSIRLQGVGAFIPDAYISDDIDRITIYRKINSLNSLEKANSLKLELEDRFGKIPDQVNSLIEMRLLRIIGSQMNIEKILFRDNHLELIYRLGYHPSPGLLSELAGIFSGLSFKGSDPFGLNFEIKEVDDVLSFTSSIIRKISEK